MKVLSERGQWAEGPDGLPVRVTLHPSALLRQEPSDRERKFSRCLDDVQAATSVPEPR